LRLYSERVASIHQRPQDILAQKLASPYQQQDAGVLDRIWAALVEECEEFGGVEWEWQAADGAVGKARFGGIS
jgi:hypothetical protein